ncbi:MAG: ABC transporter ATP-binding protein [Clostridiales bacterium]|nr:ABC transporter ATP-binding protein [Clostridiales bacterium]
MGKIEFLNVTKTYKAGDVKIRAVDDISFFINQGEFATVIGPSGAGKTTVLNLLGGMDRASSGKIFVNEEDIVGFNDKKLNTYRRLQVGFVFQFYNLMPNLTALENVELAQQISKSPFEAEEMLIKVGLKDRMANFPSQLSGGEQQRVAIARALCKNPDLLLCDEPTGALDSETGRMILSLLSDVSASMGKTVLIITHNSAIVPAAQRVIRMKNGKILSNVENDTPIQVEDILW